MSDLSRDVSDAYTRRSGKVTKGALSILSELPIQYVIVKDLPELVLNPGMASNAILVLFNDSHKFIAKPHR